MPDPKVSQNPVEVVDSDSGETTVSQNPVEVIDNDSGEAVVSQNPVEVLTNDSTTIRITQGSLEMVERVLPPPTYIGQMVVEVIGKGLFPPENNVIVFVVA